jgi:hypothetical protein
MDIETRKNWSQNTRKNARAVADALAGATRRARRASGAGQVGGPRIVHHLADSEMTSAIRMRNVIATDNVAIVGYDQEVFAKRLCRPADCGVARRLQGGARAAPAARPARTPVEARGHRTGTGATAWTWLNIWRACTITPTRSAARVRLRSKS